MVGCNNSDILKIIPQFINFLTAFASYGIRHLYYHLHDQQALTSENALEDKEL